MNNEMIAYVQKKIQGSNLSAKVVQGDMRTFSLPEKVDCALVFLGSLYVTTNQELDTHLASVASALNSGGLYILESVVAFYPEDVHTQSWEIIDGSIEISTTYTANWIDEKEKLLSGKIALDIIDGEEEKHIEHAEIRKIFAADDLILRAEQNNEWEYLASCRDFNLQEEPKEGARNIIILRRK
jgi:hypothetical protein